jgi:hypothetical protein
MTVSSTTRKAGPFAGNGATTVFPFIFKVFDKTDVKVLLVNASGVSTALTLDSDYSVSLSTNQDAAPGGSVSYPITGSPMPTGFSLVMLGDLPYDQETDITNQGGFFPQVIEDMSDRSTIQIQQLAEITSRAIVITEAESTSPVLPNAAARANQIIGFDALGNITLLSLPASVGAGDMHDEIGSDGKPGFVAGTDFIPGTTTQFVLSRAPGSKANVWVEFDSAYQGGDQILSLVGNVLTLTAPIPFGVQRAYIRTGTTLSTQIPPDGSVTDASLAPGSKVHNRVNDTVSARDFEAKGDGVADDTAALQAFLTHIGTNSLAGHIPAGVYLVSAPLTLQLSDTSGGTNAQGARASLCGDGAGSTLLFYTGASTSPVLSVIGTSAFDDLVSVSGFRINRPFGTPAGTGLLLQNTIEFLLEDLGFTGFNVGYNLTNVNNGKLLKVRASGNNTGFTTQQGGGVTAPNLIEWDTCSFNSNVLSAGVSLLETVQTFRNCDFEGNGNGTQPTLTLTYNGGTGTVGSAFYGCYFEGNWGPADIQQTLVNPMPHGNMVVDSTVFDKISATKFVTNHIFVDASQMSAVGSPFNMQVRGCGFFNGGLAPHNAAIVQAPGGSGYFGFRSNDMLNDNTYSFPLTEGPGITQSSLINGEAVCQISSAGVLSNNFGVTSCAKTGTGQYTLTIPQLTSASALVTVTPNTTGIAQAGGAVSSATQVIVQTASGTGAATDVASTVRVKML